MALVDLCKQRKLAWRYGRTKTSEFESGRLIHQLKMCDTRVSLFFVEAFLLGSSESNCNNNSSSSSSSPDGPQREMCVVSLLPFELLHLICSSVVPFPGAGLSGDGPLPTYHVVNKHTRREKLFRERQEEAARLQRLLRAIGRNEEKALGRWFHEKVPHQYSELPEGGGGDLPPLRLTPARAHTV
jgi:hypothetical protein